MTSTFSPALNPVAEGGIRISPSARTRMNMKLLFPKIGSARYPSVTFRSRTGTQSSLPVWDDKLIDNLADIDGTGGL